MTKGKIIFKGSFIGYFIKSLVLFALSLATFGLLLPYWIYWNAKYFVSNMAIELYDKK